MARLFDDALSQYLAVTSTPVTDNPASLACWFYPDDLTIDQALVTLSDADGSEALRIWCAGAVVGDPIRATSAVGFTTASAYTSTGASLNTWHHACGVFSSDAARAAYIDGGSKGTNATSINNGALDRIYIGYNRPAYPFYHSGGIAEVAVWNVALSDNDVAMLAMGISPFLIHPADLLAYYPLIRDCDRDRVGGYNLTAYNSPTIMEHPPKVHPWWLRPWHPRRAAAAPPTERSLLMMMGVG